MTAATSLIPGLDDIVRHGAPERRLEAISRIADLFFEDGTAARAVPFEWFSLVD